MPETNKPIVYLHKILTLTDELSTFNIQAQLDQAKIENAKYNIVELDSFTENQLLIFTGLQLAAISEKLAYVGTWWAFDNCVVIFTVYTDGSTKTEIISNLSELNKVRETHIIGQAVYDLLMNQPLLAVNQEDQSFYPSIYKEQPENFNFLDGDINNYIELRNQVFLNELYTEDHQVGLHILQNENKPNVLFCGELIAREISFKKQIDLYYTAGGKYLCYEQITRFFGRVEHSVTTLDSESYSEILSHNLHKQLDAHIENKEKCGSVDIRKMRVLH